MDVSKHEMTLNFIDTIGRELGFWAAHENGNPTRAGQMEEFGKVLVGAAATLKTAVGGQCREEKHIEWPKRTINPVRCQLDAGHDGAHEDGDWGWTA